VPRIRFRAIHHVIQLPLRRHRRRPLQQRQQRPPCITISRTTTTVTATRRNSFWNRPIYGAVRFSLILGRFKNSLSKCVFLLVLALSNHRVVCNAPIETATTRVRLPPTITKTIIVIQMLLLPPPPATAARVTTFARVNVGSFGAKTPIHCCIPTCWMAMFSLFNVKRRNVSWPAIKSMDAIGMQKTSKSRGVRSHPQTLLPLAVHEVIAELTTLLVTPATQRLTPFLCSLVSSRVTTLFFCSPSSNILFL
jgi:hypothetical protein